MVETQSGLSSMKNSPYKEACVTTQTASSMDSHEVEKDEDKCTEDNDVLVAHYTAD